MKMKPTMKRVVSLGFTAFVAVIAVAAEFVSPQEKSPANGAAAVFEKSILTIHSIQQSSTCKSEILFGENTVHALRQSPGVGSRAGNGCAQNEFPARGGREVCRQVLPLLFWGAHPLQFLLRWSHGCSLEENHMLNSRAS